MNFHTMVRKIIVKNCKFCYYSANSKKKCPNNGKKKLQKFWDHKVENLKKKIDSSVIKYI